MLNTLCLIANQNSYNGSITSGPMDSNYMSHSVNLKMNS